MKIIFRTRTAVLLLLFAGLLLYFNSLTNGFIGDDEWQILKNPSVHSLGNALSLFGQSTYGNGGNSEIVGLFYRPLMILSYTVIYSFFGPKAFFFHLFQVSLHIANGLLVYFFLKKFFKNTTSFLCALLFLIHPINNEAVTYIANMQDTLFFFFGMLALIFTAQENTGLLKKLAIPLLLLFSLLSKETGALFILMVLIYEFIFVKKRFRFFALSFSTITLIYLFLRYGVAKLYLAQTSIAPIASASLGMRLLNTPLAFFYYLSNFLIPWDLGAEQFWMISKATLFDFYLPLLFVLFCAWVLLRFIKNEKRKKNFPVILFFSLWFLAGLFLHSQIIPLDALVAYRWFYFPSLGLIALLGSGWESLKLNNILVKRLLISSLIIIFISFAVRTYYRNFVWHDAFTLFAHDIKVTRSNFILQNGLATEYIKREEYGKAKPLISKSIKEKPYYANLNNMAIVLLSEGNKKGAKEYLKRAINVGGYRYSYTVYENYANFLLTYDDPKEALEFSQKAVTFFPANEKLWLIMAKAAYLEDDKKVAVNAAETAYGISRSKEAEVLYNNLKKGYPIPIYRNPGESVSER